MVSVFQIALAAGAAIGGALVDSFGIGSVFLASAAVCNARTLIPLTFSTRIASLSSTSPALGATK